MGFYDGSKLCKKLDLDGNKPEIIMAAGNRTSGKTTWFHHKMVEDYLNDGKKFALLFRFKYELDDVAEKFFKDIGNLFYPDKNFYSKSCSDGIYHRLFLDDKECGYAISINSADQIKKMSHLFSDTDQGYMDEFQSETDHYCGNEIQKFMSVHTSIARGKGKMARFVPFYMSANCVSLLNPYYAAMGISDRIQKETKFLRGHGFVLEQNYNEEAAYAQLTSGFMKAFAGNEYVSYGAQNVYLNDNMTFIERPKGKSRYLGTLAYNNGLFGVRAFPDDGLMYCDCRPDKTAPYRVAVTTADHKVNFVMLKQFELFISQLRWYFEKGCFRFQNLRSKEALMKAIAYY